MHSQLVSSMSKPLKALVCGSSGGSMREARDGVIEWPEVDRDTFIRFWEFAYKDDYEPAKPRSQASMSGVCWDQPDLTAEPEPVVEPVTEPDLFRSRPKKSKKKYEEPYEPSNKKEHLWHEFKTTIYGGLTKTLQDGVTDPSSNHVDMLLSHASLYAFADCYDISPLMDLTLSKLHQELVAFKLSSDRVADINELVKFCYANTVDKQQNPDRLRELLVAYTACKLEDLWPDLGFQKVLEESAEFSKAVIGQLILRLD